MREKLIELLSYFGDCYIAEERHIVCDTKICEIADHLIANGVTIGEDKNVPSKWISVKDRLPKPGERVLVCVGAVFEAFIDDHGKWQRYYSAPLNDVLGEPTHWMPLPEPPREKSYE